MRRPLTDTLVRLRQHVSETVAALLFCLLYGLYHANHPNGFSAQVLLQNMNESLALILAAMAQTIPVLTGGIDLSVGAVMTMSNCLASHVLSGTPWQVFGGMVLCLALAAGFGAVNGLVIVFGRVQPIVATLATSAIALGVALWLRPYPGGEINETLSWVLMGNIADVCDLMSISEDMRKILSLVLPVPVSFLVMLLALVCWWLLQRTVSGRSIYAIGSSENAAFMSGLPIVRTKILAYALSGLLAGCAGIFMAVQTASGNADLPQAGTYTLTSIAAVVIGGCALTGGVGGMLGAVLGALILRVIAFNFRIFEVEPLIQPLIEGAILLGAISVSSARLLQVKNRLELFR